MVAGDGPDRGKLEALAAPLPVTFLGYVAHADVPALYRAADVSVRAPPGPPRKHRKAFPQLAVPSDQGWSRPRPLNKNPKPTKPTKENLQNLLLE